jgi:hypothetical protein
MSLLNWHCLGPHTHPPVDSHLINLSGVGEISDLAAWRLGFAYVCINAVAMRGIRPPENIQNGGRPGGWMPHKWTG